MNKIELIKTEMGYTVIVDDEFADCLTRDEALGVVASALFSSHRPIFLKTYEQWTAWERRFRVEPKKPVALLEDKRVL